MKLYCLLSIITIFALSFVNAKKSKVNNDRFYMVLAEKDLKDGKNKREEKEQFLDALVTEINNLIIGNKDTYDDPSLLEKLEEAPAPVTPFTKRSDVKDEKENENDEEDDEKKESEHKFAYVISSLENESVISSYLSEELVPLVKDMPNVKAVVPDFKVEFFSNNRCEYLEEIKKTTKWENPSVKKNVYNHLSLISQDKFDDSNNSTTYDENYYYPSSAGEGINIFIPDSGFNFNNDEYSNRSTKDEKKERITQCIGSVGYNILFDDFNDRCINFLDKGHGNAVANIAGGLKNGVASKANIFGISILGIDNRDSYYGSSLLQALEYIKFRYLNETITENIEKFINKSVINISSGYDLCDENRDYTKYLGELIKEMSNQGSVFVASAGNDSKNVDDLIYPCSFDDVICVGATDNIGINDDYYAKMELKKYKNDRTVYPDYDVWEDLYDKADVRYSNNKFKFFNNKFATSKSYRRAYFSNYGKKVDIYAPGFAKAISSDMHDYESVNYGKGTSISSPIVAGVAATIMSEKPNKKYTTKEMKKELQRIGLKNIIEDVGEDQPNLFINNGNHLRYNYEKDENNKVKTDELECTEYSCCLRD